MFYRFLNAIGLATLLALLLALPVFAGGWAVITLDELPAGVVAGEPVEIGFMVRQHGVTPMANLEPVINARLPGLNKPVTVTAKEEGDIGHYVATLTLPQAGEWEWTIEAFTVNQPMPPLTVVASSLATEKSVPVAPQWPQVIITPLGVIGTIGGLVVAFRKRSRWAVALIVAGLAVSGAGFVSAAGQPKVESDAAPLSSDPSVSQVEMGRELFIAKGCMVCHSHVETNGVREFGIDSGPNLSKLTASPEYLRIWLKDPLAAKSTAKMPNLGLSEAEIDALIAFINAE
jgi:cytochrome c2